MRTTVEFEEDTARALERFRSTTGMGVSEAANHLVRRGLRIDVSNTADAIDLLEGSRAH